MQLRSVAIILLILRRLFFAVLTLMPELALVHFLILFLLHEQR